MPYWWIDVYPTLDLAALGAVEGIQGPGETIFVPAGWWHAVLNLESAASVGNAELCGARVLLVRGAQLHHS